MLYDLSHAMNATEISLRYILYSSETGNEASDVMGWLKFQNQG
jgi:hypothetical protein